MLLEPWTIGMFPPGENSSDALTFYDTRLLSKGHYLDLVGKVGKLRGNYNLSDTFSEYADAHSWFYSLSAEYGRKKTLGSHGWYVEPQAQLTYGHVNSGDYVSTQGTHGQLDGFNSLIFRVGTTIGNHYAKPEAANFYAKVFWNREFLGATDYSFVDKNNATLSGSKDYKDSWVTVGFGMNGNLNKRTNLYLDIEKNFGGELSSNWLLDMGLRWEF